MEESSPKKIYVDKNNKAVLVCPACGNSKTVDFSNYLNTHRSLMIKFRFRCKRCAGSSAKSQSGSGPQKSGDIFVTAILERRKYYRKQVKLVGSVFSVKNNLQAGIEIFEISRQGVTFHVNIPNILEKGAEVMVEFRLDDVKRTLIKKRVEIREIRGKIVGALFADHDPSDKYEKAIGFYLFN